MNPAEQRVDGPRKDPVVEALLAVDVELAEYAAEFFDSVELRPVTDAVIRSLAETGPEAATNQSTAWLEYKLVQESLTDSTLLEGGEAAFIRAQLSGLVHKAMIFKVTEKSARFFNELKIAETLSYEEGIDDINEILYEYLEAYLDQTDMTLEHVEYVLFEEHTDILSPEHQRALEEEIFNGFDLQDVLGEVYHMVLEQGGVPEDVFALLGFPDTIPL